MNCPICQKKLQYLQSNAGLCREHGVLLSANFLKKLKKGDFKFDHTFEERHIKQHDSNRSIICPNSKDEMVPTDFLSTGIIIDSCPKCPYRWLDAGEIRDIEEHEVKLPVEAVELLLKIEGESDLYKSHLVHPDDTMLHSRDDGFNSPAWNRNFRFWFLPLGISGPYRYRLNPIRPAAFVRSLVISRFTRYITLFVVVVVVASFFFLFKYIKDNQY